MTARSEKNQRVGDLEQKLGQPRGIVNGKTVNQFSRATNTIQRIPFGIFKASAYDTEKAVQGRDMQAATTPRVLLDGSCKTGSGLNLNYVLPTGEKPQLDFGQILLRLYKDTFFNR